MIKTKIDWDSIDWSLPWKDIEEQTGVHYTSVRSQARARGIEPSRTHRFHTHPGFYYNWEDVDWGQSNATIARLKGCSRWMVSLVRKSMTNTYSRKGRVYFNDGTPWEDLAI